jgi:hypothetical protein
MGEATGFSILLPLVNRALLDAIGSKVIEVIVLLVVLLVEDRPALEVVNAHASHDVPQDPGFKRRGNGSVYQGSTLPCYSMFLRRSPWTLPFLWSS